MKYYESDKKFAKAVGSAGFYALIVCCLIAIGAASYFAVTKFKTQNEKDTPKSNSSVYDGGDNTYNSNTDVKEPDTDTNSASEVKKSESSIPYESKEEKTPEVKPQKQSVSFTMPVENGKVIKGYSDSVLQYSSTYNDMRMHTGIDISCNKSSYVKSCADGVVKTISENAELGRYIEIEHINGIVLRYCGLESINVENGKAVKCGDFIGTVGTVTSECMDTPHIHIEVYKDSKLINPAQILGF